MNFKRALTENLGIKIIAVVVALFIWFNVSSQEQMTRLFMLPVKLVNIPDSLSISGKVPLEAEASITATKRQLLYMGFKKAFVSVSLSGAAPGRIRQTLSASNVMLPSGISPNNVRVLSPTSIDFYFERRITREIPVGLALSGSLPEGYLLTGAPSVDPTLIEVSGGESHVNHLKSIPTKTVDLGKVKESFEREVELDYDHKVLQCKPDVVKAFIAVSPRTTRTLANIPPTILLDNSGLGAEVTPKTVSLTLEGPKAILDTLSSGDVSVLIDLSGTRPGIYKFAPEIIVPDGIEKFSINVESLSVDIGTRHKEQEK